MKQGVPRRVWLVWVDHSVAGVWRSKREANASVQLRVKGSLFPVAYTVTGPYVLQDGAS
jgi:hypothetical protein